MIPDKNHSEWRGLIDGSIKHNFSNFVLQLKVNQLSKDYNKQKISLEEAVDEIYNLCSKYQLAVRSDLETIFNS